MFLTNGMSLTNGTIGVSVTNLPIGMFLTNVTTGMSLTNVTIGDSVTNIGSYAFSGSGLRSVMIPDSVFNIGEGAFAICPKLGAITVDPVNPVYCSVNGVLFSHDQTTLIQCPGARAGSFAVPDSVITIGTNAFVACTGLTSVTLGTNAYWIDDYALTDAPA